MVLWRVGFDWLALGSCGPMRADASIFRASQWFTGGFLRGRAPCNTVRKAVRGMPS